MNTTFSAALASEQEPAKSATAAKPRISQERVIAKISLGCSWGQASSAPSGRADSRPLCCESRSGKRQPADILGRAAASAFRIGAAVHLTQVRLHRDGRIFRALAGRKAG